MSERINHHYVSQCHLKEFFNNEEGKIYLYDKQLRNYYQKSGTRKILSEKDLNTKLLDNKIDRNSMEIELQVLFEDDFAKHIGAVKQFHENQKSIEKAYWEMNHLALMALVGEYRNPAYKAGLDHAMDSIKLRVTGSEEPDPKVKYQNAEGYLDVDGKKVMLVRAY
jgi:hypothetical protein